MRINLAVGIATGILTIVVLLCGEIVPKTWAVLCSEKLALSYCNIIYLLDAGTHTGYYRGRPALPWHYETVTY